jgi:uncharacterized protein YcfJ
MKMPINFKNAPVFAAVLALASPLWVAAQPVYPQPAYEQAKVVSSTPVVKQVQMQQRVCNNQPVEVPAPNTGAGAVLGAIVGGAVGSAVGQGSGNAAATALGAVGGAIIGNQAEGSGTRVQNAVSCTVRQTTQNVTVYQVVYEWGGKSYSVEMPRDPGPSITVQVAPVVAQAGMPGTLPGTLPPMDATVGTTTTVVVPQAPPVYNVYPYGYVVPPAVGLYWGYGWGPRYRWGRHHW